ncbi:molybdenum cofactor biosynthesis protein MoaE [Acinetobacter sp. I-MWF]|nr:molybdenum cofactor biosynthesis protein MoaE [Acinetobacter sp. I-MWF]MCT9977859.1 molybdenum cofactor biosynthesis protein MoaE [Acinetobacter sp. I-MWF]
MHTFEQTFKQFNRIQDTPLSQDSFDPIQDFPECGGIGIFIGTVRNHHEGKAVKALKYTAYAPVSEKMIRQIEQEIQQKFAVAYVRVIHRIGALNIGEKAIIAIAYAAHRREAFSACEEAVERVKHEVPVWKEEFYLDGTSQYVAGCCIRKDDVEQDHSVQKDSFHHHDCEHDASHHHSSQHNHSQHALVHHFTSAHLGHTHLEPSSQQQDHEREQHVLLSKQCEQTIYQWHM